MLHLGLWAPSTLFFGLAFIGIFKEVYVVYIEHVISNLNWLIYFSMIVTMSINGWRSADLQSFLEITIYTLVLGLGANFMEST